MRESVELKVPELIARKKSHWNTGPKAKGNGMSTLVESFPSVRYADSIVWVEFPGGTSLQLPVSDNRNLVGGTLNELSRMEVFHFGIHWPALDECLSFAGLACGDYGQNSPPTLPEG